MGEDRKFKFENGQFVNRVSGEAIPHDEPVIIFRARDVHSLSVLEFYYDLANDPHHRQAILDRIRDFSNFKVSSPDRMKEPGVTHHIELHSSRRHPFLEAQNGEDNMTDDTLWFDRAIRNHEAEHGPSGGGWNISMVLERLHRENPHQGRGRGSEIEERVEALEHREDSTERKVEQAMADIDELTSILNGISSDASTLGADFKNLEAELQAAQVAAANNQPIDLTNAILVARSAQSALDAIVQAAGAAPAPLGGGDTTQPPVDTTQPPADTTQPPADTSGSGSDTTQPPVDQQPPVGSQSSDTSGSDQTTQPPADGASV